MWRKGEEPLEKLFEDSSPPLLSHFSSSFGSQEEDALSCFCSLITGGGFANCQIFNVENKKQEENAPSNPIP